MTSYDDKQKNDKEIAARAAHYPITTDTLVKGLPMLKGWGVPWRELPTLEWLKMVRSLAVELVVDSVFHTLVSYLDRLIVGLEWRPHSGMILLAEAPGTQAHGAPVHGAPATHGAPMHEAEAQEAQVNEVNEMRMQKVQEIFDEMFGKQEQEPDEPTIADVAPGAPPRLSRGGAGSVGSGDSPLQRVPEPHQRIAQTAPTVGFQIRAAGPSRVASVPPTSLTDYHSLFANPKHRPDTLDEIDNDFAFTRLRVAGYAPMQMRKMDDETWNLLNLKDYKGDNENTLLADALEARKDGRLYCTSYAMFKGLPGGKSGGIEKYVVSPIALFQIPKDKDLAARAGVTVMGIQVVAGDLSTTFVPQDDIWAWRYAKLSFNSAEGNYHEGISHLGETHLVVEAMALSLHHSLTEQHPVSVLMKEHFFGTIFINWAASKALIQPGSLVDDILALPIEEVNKLVSAKVLEVLGSDLSYPARMEAAGLTEKHFPCTNYPFREDADELWKATLKWVTGYINCFYKTDQAIVDDMQLDNLRNNMIALGKITWIEKEWPAGGGTKGFVAKMLTSFIFIGSVMHAAVNFPQHSAMSTAGCVPLATYTEPLTPKTAKEENVLKALPPLDRAKTQKLLGALLGGIHCTKLGHYKDDTFGTNDTYVEVRCLLKTYKKELATITTNIKERNERRVAAWHGHDSEVSKNLQEHWAYPTLLPNNVPQSINI